MQYYSAVTLLACLGAAILMVQVASNSVLTRRSKRDILLSAAMIIIATSCEYLGVRLDGADKSLRGIHCAVKFLELSVAPAIPVMFGAGICPPKRHVGLIVALVAHMLLEFASMFWGITYYIDAQNVYNHCRLYWMYYLAYALGVLFMIERVVQFTRAYQNQTRASLLCIMLYVMLGVTWQAFDVSMRVVWMSVCVGVILFYNYYCNLLQQIDPLTKLLNRRSFEAHMRQHPKGVLLIADVDEFKLVNDRFGHLYGDRCLTEVGAALKEVYGKYGLCFRIGGDEFAVMLRHIPGSVETLNTALDERLKAQRRADPQLPGVSVGYARIDDEHFSIEEAMAWADQKMYGHKERRRHG